MTQCPFPNFSELQLRVDGVNATPRHRYAVDVAARASTRLVREPRQFRESRSTQADEDDWNEFNDINKIVLRQRPPSHAVDATQLHQRRRWVVFSPISRPFGPRGRLDASSLERESHT